MVVLKEPRQLEQVDAMSAGGIKRIGIEEEKGQLWK